MTRIRRRDPEPGPPSREELTRPSPRRSRPGVFACSAAKRWRRLRQVERVHLAALRPRGQWRGSTGARGSQSVSQTALTPMASRILRGAALVSGAADRYPLARYVCQAQAASHRLVRQKFSGQSKYRRQVQSRTFGDTPPLGWTVPERTVQSSRRPASSRGRRSAGQCSHEEDF